MMSKRNALQLTHKSILSKVKKTIF